MPRGLENLTTPRMTDGQEVNNLPYEFLYGRDMPPPNGPPPSYQEATANSFPGTSNGSSSRTEFRPTQTTPNEQNSSRQDPTERRATSTSQDIQPNNQDLQNKLTTLSEYNASLASLRTTYNQFFDKSNSHLMKSGDASQSAQQKEAALQRSQKYDKKIMTHVTPKLHALRAEWTTTVNYNKTIDNVKNVKDAKRFITELHREMGNEYRNVYDQIQALSASR